MINFDGANVSECRKYDLLTFCEIIFIKVQIVFSMSGNMHPFKMNLVDIRNPMFEVPRARHCQNDKFVAVGVPEAETSENLIVFTC